MDAIAFDVLIEQSTDATPSNTYRYCSCIEPNYFRMVQISIILCLMTFVHQVRKAIASNPQFPNNQSLSESKGVGNVLMMCQLIIFKACQDEHDNSGR